MAISKRLIPLIIIILFIHGYLPAQSEDIKWELLHYETFDSLIVEPEEWVEDTYGDTSRWNVDIFDEDGDFFRDKYGSSAFDSALNEFRSFRKSFTYGEDDWLTIELYGRDEDKDGQPESGGKIINKDGKARLISERHTDAAMIRSTQELPEIYRIELTVSNINFGGDKNDDGDWWEDGKFNGYDGDEIASPWRKNWALTEWLDAWHENGLYFLCITDFENPAPHNNVFWHHHRKVVMDTDNNNYDGTSWSYVYNPNTSRFEEDGNSFTGLIWLNGENFGDDFTGNFFTSWTPAGWQTEEWNTNFADKYLPDESYTFMIERTPGFITMSVSGRFYYGGDTVYIAKKKIDEFPVVWHYNRHEMYDGSKNEVKKYFGKTIDTWPADSYYPDYFFCGDPHINYYEGSADYDDIKLWKGTVATNITEKKQKLEYRLTNYPNPFNPKTTIQYQLAESGHVKLAVYNLLGQILDVLVEDNKQPGTYTAVWDASGYSSGIYIVRMEAAGHISTRKISLIR